MRIEFANEDWGWPLTLNDTVKVTYSRRDLVPGPVMPDRVSSIESATMIVDRLDGGGSPIEGESQSFKLI